MNTTPPIDPAFPHSGIVVGMLGYGGRLPSVEALSLLASHPAVEKVLLFWNAPSEEVEKTLAELAARFQNIGIHCDPENLGSASGYKRIMERFRDHETSPFLLLLDDDLRLGENCIPYLLQAADTYSSGLDHTVFVAYRPGLPELADLVTKNIPINRPRPGCCIGFHFLNVIKPESEPIDRDAESGHFRIGSAPWGGLFIPRIALQKLGLPREDFFLYAEDYELTARFVWNGGKIVLLPEAVISDSDTAWNAVGGKISNVRRRMLNLPDMKVFHEVRNRNFMARHYYPGILPVYWINKSVFLAYVYLLALRYRKFSRALLIHQAINQGEKMAAREKSKAPS